MKNYDENSPFHEGEQIVQERIGSREKLAYWGPKAIRPFFPEQHRDFFAQLPFVVISACDAQNLPWITLLAASKAPLVTSPDDTHLHFSALPAKGDALDGALKKGSDIGLIGIELHSRRRNRASGMLAGIDAEGMNFQVIQSYGNCPQYINEREWHYEELDPEAIEVSQHQALTPSMQTWIAAADTLFIGSGYRAEGEREAYGMDASHRGGASGFVKVVNEKQLIIPDYAGNNFFNTIGNLLLNPKAGLLFVDFETGSLLQLSGRVTIDWDSEAIDEFIGAHRLLIVDIDHIVEQINVLPLRWSLPVAFKDGLELLNKKQESDSVTSFIFADKTRAKLPLFRAGQHLPIELSIIDANQNIQQVERTYSLSNSAADPYYRISVKRELNGLASNYLHDHLQVGDVIQAKKPNGDFLLKFPANPVVLISAGIGVTPIASMLHALVGMSVMTRTDVFYSVRNGQQAPLLEEIRHLIAQDDRTNLTVNFSQPNEADVLDKNYDYAGRLDANKIKESIPSLHADFYLCGPMDFISSMMTGLEALGVKREQIYFETF